MALVAAETAESVDSGRPGDARSGTAAGLAGAAVGRRAESAEATRADLRLGADATTEAATADDDSTADAAAGETEPGVECDAERRAGDAERKGERPRPEAAGLCEEAPGRAVAGVGRSFASD